MVVSSGYVPFCESADDDTKFYDPSILSMCKSCNVFTGKLFLCRVF